MKQSDQLIRIVALQSPEISHQLQWTGFRRLNLQVGLCHTAEDLFGNIDAQIPDVVILNTYAEEIDAFEVCRTLKVDKGLQQTPVLIHSTGALSRTMHPTIVESQCDELVIGSLARGQIYETLAPYLGIPTRTDQRVHVSADAAVSCDSHTAHGRVFDLTVSGARLILDSTPPTDAMVRVALTPKGNEPIEVNARMVWSTERGKDAEVAVQFVDVPEAIALILRQITSWEVRSEDGRQIVRIHRGLSDRTTLDGLSVQLKERVDFDLSNVLTITSVGISRWVQFLRELGADTSYRFIGCSTAFCTQASYVRDMLGRGHIISVYAPYYSAQYDYEAERELFVADFGTEFPPQPPQFPCPLGGSMTFDDLPDRYFYFLDPARS